MLDCKNNDLIFIVTISLIKSMPCTSFWQWLLLYIQHGIFVFFFIFIFFGGNRSVLDARGLELSFSLVMMAFF